MKITKKLIAVLLAMTCACSLMVSASASELKPSASRIDRKVAERIQGNNPVMSEEEAIQATNLIAEKAALEESLFVAGVNASDARSIETARIRSIENELEAMGAVPLTIEDVYALHGRSYTPGAPSVPSDTNYVHFYGLTAHIDEYDVYCIIASSRGFSQAQMNVPFYRAGEAVIFDTDAYVQSDFNKYIELATEVGEAFFEETFDKLPILSYLSDVWTLSTYFNPTAQQKFTIGYTCGQTYMFAYVAEESVGYYDFALTAERKQGNCTFKFEKCVGGDFIIPNGGYDAYNFEALSEYWADYDYAVEVYQDYATDASYVGDIEFVVGNAVVESISMPYYSELWSIPGI